ncbi:hypothetical protein ARMSODRAFT_965650 [Armillaria solidipes]|uniref:Uncharacterized protein n=1 Tax=Armillaria solidipes TaxID=1076256 RepID=A0A2H3APN5_9AGAR|nr:hypothetical protein ARMSODRAFT_965650 [Armillaria solidipes]
MRPLCDRGNCLSTLNQLLKEINIVKLVIHESEISMACSGDSTAILQKRIAELLQPPLGLPSIQSSHFGGLQYNDVTTDAQGHHIEGSATLFLRAPGAGHRPTRCAEQRSATSLPEMLLICLHGRYPCPIHCNCQLRRPVQGRRGLVQFWSSATSDLGAFYYHATQSRTKPAGTAEKLLGQYLEFVSCLCFCSVLAVTGRLT